MSEVIMSEVKMSEVEMSEVIMSEVKMSEVKMSEVKMSEVIMSEVKMSEVKGGYGLRQGASKPEAKGIKLLRYLYVQLAAFRRARIPRQLQDSTIT